MAGPTGKAAWRRTLAAPALTTLLPVALPAAIVIAQLEKPNH